MKKINVDVIKYKNTIIITIVFIVVLYIAYKLSKSYRVSKVLNDISLMDGYVLVSSKLNEHRELKLCDFYIASAFRPYLGPNQYLEYIDLSITEKIITNGVRSIYVDVFNDNMGEFANPVISTGVKSGQWKLSLNSVTFEDLCKLLSTIVFNAGYVNNYEDPFILMLNLNVNNNLNSLNKMRDIIYTHFRRYLLSNKYTYGKVNIGQVPIKYLKKKMLIFSSDGYQDSELDEFINYSWEREALKKISYESLDPSATNPSVLKLDSETLRNYNKNNLTIVTPNESFSITSIFTKNYKPNYFWDSGCQIVCLNYQLIDDHIDTYLSKFKNDSFIPKPDDLRGAAIRERVNLQETELSKKLKDPNLENDHSCPDAPSEDYVVSSGSLNYKDENSPLGLCFISEDKNCNSEKDTTNPDDKTCPNDSLYSTYKYKSDYQDNSQYLCCSNTRTNRPNNKDPYDNIISSTKYYISQTDNAVGDNSIEDSLIEGTSNFKSVDTSSETPEKPVPTRKDNRILSIHKLNYFPATVMESLENKNVCLIDKNNPARCPSGWDKTATTGYGYNICCKNT